MHIDKPAVSQFFKGVSNTTFQSSVEELKSLTAQEAEYVLWLYECFKMEQGKFMQRLDLVEVILQIPFFPISLIIRRDMPSLHRFLTKRMQEQNDKAQREWKNILTEEQMEHCKEVFRYFSNELYLEEIGMSAIMASKPQGSDGIQSQFVALLTSKVQK